MLHTLRGSGFDFLLTLISLRDGTPPAPPLCVSYKMRTGVGILLYYGEVFSHKVYILWICLQVNYLGGVINTAKSASGVSLTLRSQAQRCHCHHEVRLCDVSLTLMSEALQCHCHGGFLRYNTAESVQFFVMPSGCF